MAFGKEPQYASASASSAEGDMGWLALGDVGWSGLKNGLAPASLGESSSSLRPWIDINRIISMSRELHVLGVGSWGMAAGGKAGAGGKDTSGASLGLLWGF